MRFSASASVLACAAVAAVLAAPTPAPAPAPLPEPTPPGIPGASTARTLLAGLETASPGSGQGYSRHKFPHWETIRGTCNTREFVLRRDGEDVRVNKACVAESGTWTSPYDGASWTDASDLDIDHMVPLKNAWISGASSWTTEERRAFANDIARPQLWAVTDKVNESKGASSPDVWRPPLESFHCTYARSWVQVKSHYDLTVTEAERHALADMLETC